MTSRNLRTKPNYLYTIISTTLVLFLLGFLGLIYLHGQELLNSLKEKVNFIVEFREDTRGAQIDSVRNYLKNNTAIIPTSVSFISKADAFEFLKEDFGEDFEQLDLPNPLHDVLLFNVTSSKLDPVSIGEIKKDVRSFPYVRDVFYQEGLVEQLSENLKKLSYFLGFVSLIFLILTIALIHNTIRLALYSNRFLIKNMEMVGASWGFISKPYIVRSLVNGLISAILAIVLLVAILIFAKDTYIDFNELNEYKGLALLFGLIIITGILISSFSTWYVVNKYLRMKIDDLY